MTYPAIELVNRSWYLSGIIARDQETVPGEYTTEGLFLLNSLLDFKSADLILIPYFKLYQFNMVTGQELYTIPDLYEIQTMTFNIGDVRYPMCEMTDVKYFGNGRVDNIQSLPFSWNLIRAKGGSELRVYYSPTENYVSHIYGKFALTDVSLNQDMSLTYDGFYLEYLRYCLAEYMCNEWDVEFSAAKKKMLQTYEKKLTYIQPMDLTIQKTSVIGSHQPMNWAHANISPAWNI